MSTRRGRPPLDPADPTVKVCLTLKSRQYDAVYKRATRAHVSVPEVIRRALDPRPPRYLK